jgi:glutamyl-tRNA synthetase
VRTTIEMGRALSTYAQDPSEYDPDGRKKHVKPETAAQLEKLITALEALPDWSAASSEAALRRAAEAEGISAGKLIHPTRLALTGVTVGAPLFDVVELLGRETALRRLRRFVEAVKSPTPA